MSGVTGTTRTPGDPTQEESSSKRDRTEPFNFPRKGRRNATETAHEASASSPFGRYT